MSIPTVLVTILIVILLCGCNLQLQRTMSAVEMGCEKEKVVFPKGEAAWYEFMPQYWEVNCGDRRYVCQPFAGVPILLAPSAKCKEIIP